MTKTIRSFLGAVLAGVIAAAGVHYGLLQAGRNAVQPYAQPVIDQVTEITAPANRVVASLLGVKPEQTPAPAKAVLPPGTRTVLLSEPIVILNGSTQPNEAIPQGTPVAVLAQGAQYAQVRYQDRVITIPRTATVTGVYRSN